MKISKFFLLSAIALMGVACQTEPDEPNPNPGNGNDDGNEPPTEINELILKASAESLSANGKDEITFTVLADDVDVTQEATIYNADNNQEVKDAKFSTTEPGTYRFLAKVGTKTSNEVVITALKEEEEEETLQVPADPKPESVDFVHRTLIVQYTGTKCPNCHYMIAALDNLLKDETYKNSFRLAVCHSYGGDPMILEPDNVSALYSLGEFPRALVGFTEKINTASEETCFSTLQKAIDNSLQWKLRGGIAVNSKIEGNTLTVKAQFKAAKDEDEYTLGCWLLEDGIKDSQSEMGMITHNDVIRYAEKAYGNELGAIQKGETTETTYTIPLKTGWKKENCKLLLFVCFKTSGKYILSNAITVPLETAVPYEYK